MVQLLVKKDSIMNTISVAAVLKRPFFRIRGEKDTLPFALINVNGKFGKLIAPVEYTLRTPVF